MPTRTTLLLFAAFALLPACSGGELVGVHIDLAKDGSGTVTTRALATPEQAARSEGQATGVKWTARAALVASQGTFAAITDLELGGGGLRFVPQLDGERPGLRVHLARGPNTPWIDALVPSADSRRSMAKIYDPTGRTAEIADVLRIEIVAPGRIITSGVLPTGRGVEAALENRRAYLLLPVRTAITAGDEFVWDIAWLRD